MIVPPSCVEDQLQRRAVVWTDVPPELEASMDEFVRTHEPKLCATVARSLGTDDPVTHYTIRYQNIEDIPMQAMYTADPYPWYLSGFLDLVNIVRGKSLNHVDTTQPDYLQGARDGAYYMGVPTGPHSSFDRLSATALTHTILS